MLYFWSSNKFWLYLRKFEKYCFPLFEISEWIWLLLWKDEINLNGWFNNFSLILFPSSVFIFTGISRFFLYVTFFSFLSIWLSILLIFSFSFMRLVSFDNIMTRLREWKLQVCCRDTCNTHTELQKRELRYYGVACVLCSLMQKVFRPILWSIKVECLVHVNGL